VNSHPQLDLDQVARELTGLQPGWAEHGITAGQLTWRDAGATWPKPIVTSRATVAEPESVGMTLTAANGNEAILVLWRGGWADVDLLLGRHVLSRAPDLQDVAGCVALAESIAEQLTATPSSEPEEENLGAVAHRAEPMCRASSGARRARSVMNAHGGAVVAKCVGYSHGSRFHHFALGFVDC
jgi:hypothetical protein